MSEPTEPDSDGIDPSNPLHALHCPPRKMFAYDWGSGYVSPFRPAPDQALQSLLERLLPGDVLLDIGCGNGRICNAAAHLPGVRAIGIEIDAALLGEARCAAQVEGVADNVSYLEMDLRHLTVACIQDWGVTTICCYLLPPALRLLEPLLSSALTHNKLRCIMSVQWKLKLPNELLVTFHGASPLFVYTPTSS
eukprot:TRINITY_DN3477_c0_g1_i1.p1 TRINITY_DN3477_c0_g1~~TRINITY_DN3477_c0_g1_i1.p1  ORF type:complete len:193 (+),score=21.96 TRINITY_DN3477_c0_g1_i1:22-600(+)